MMAASSPQRLAAPAAPSPALSPVEVPLRVLVAGHDLRFISPLTQLLEERGHVVAADRWRRHNEHDEEVSRRLLEWAEVIVCEWCLGNAVWYSARKRPGQRLLVRFHRFEFDTDYPPQVTPDAVDLWLFAGPHFLDAAASRFGWPHERCVYLPNGVDVDRYDRRKPPGARFALGLLGYHRRLKRLDLALDVLERLRREQPRFRLSVKGQTPREIDWVWKDDDERAYFEDLEARIASAEHLRGAVDFEPYDDAVPEWFARTGFVLSLSDVESFHLAAAEGMAARAVPVLRRREGVAELFPERWIFDDVDETAVFIRRVADDEAEWEAEGRAAREHVRVTYGLEAVARAWLALVRGVTTERLDRAEVVPPP